MNANVKITGFKNKNNELMNLKNGDHLKTENTVNKVKWQGHITISSP